MCEEDNVLKTGLQYNYVRQNYRHTRKIDRATLYRLASRIIIYSALLSRGETSLPLSLSLEMSVTDEFGVLTQRAIRVKIPFRASLGLLLRFRLSLSVERCVVSEEARESAIVERSEAVRQFRIAASSDVFPYETHFRSKARPRIRKNGHVIVPFRFSLPLDSAEVTRAMSAFIRESRTIHGSPTGRVELTQ